MGKIPEALWRFPFLYCVNGYRYCNHTLDLGWNLEDAVRGTLAHVLAEHGHQVDLSAYEDAR